MHPILARFTIGGAEVVLRAYPVFYVLAGVVAIALATLVASRRGIPWTRALLVFGVSLAIGVAGARLLDLGANWGYYAEDTSRIYSPGFRGFSLYGGLILALAAGVVLARLVKADLWRLADCAVPSLVAGIALMRTGCFLNGCCFGTVTSLPWGVTFPTGSSAWALQILSGESSLFDFAAQPKPVHPTELYEIIAAAVFGALAMWLLLRHRSTPLRRTPAGVSFLVFALGFTLFRLADDFLRATLPTYSRPNWLYPVLYALICSLVGVLLVWRVRTSRRHLSTGGENAGDQ
jgi:phosphatidylglycerol---prolipoprotein diacylglyceryl transferase